MTTTRRMTMNFAPGGGATVEPVVVAPIWACETARVISYLILLALSGLIVGGLGRLVIPGPNPMSIPMTIAIGIGGSLMGGIIGNLLFNRPGGLVLAVLDAALIVWLIERSRSGSPSA